jgi:hypothetical protein
LLFSAKKFAALAAGTLTLGLTVGAYAYWAAPGAGTGSATAGSSNGTVTLHASLSDGIYPGGSTAVTFTADNPGATDLRVGVIKLDAVVVDASHSTCNTQDFSMIAVASNTTVLHGAAAQLLGGAGSLAFANDALNSQNACKGATITLQVSST